MTTRLGSAPDTTAASSTGEPEAARAAEVPAIDSSLLDALPAFELFFKTFGFKRVHGRVWGLLVLSRQPLSSREIASQLSLSQSATSTTLNQLTEWGSVVSEFDSARRCHVHAPVGNALSIVATVFRRREQVVFQQFKTAATGALEFIRQKYGNKDPRVLTLRSIITTCEIAEALMQLVLTAVNNALVDSESILSRAVNTALRLGAGLPAKLLANANGRSEDEEEEAEERIEAPPRGPAGGARG